MANTQPEIPEQLHESTEAAIEYIEDADLEVLANYLETLLEDYGEGRRSHADSDRFIRIHEAPEEGVDIGPLIDLAVYFGRIWEREERDDD